MPEITTIIIARNEEERIGDAVRSARPVGPVVVVDAESLDRTRELAAAEGARIVVHAWPGFAEQRRYAIETTTSEWILFLDADERVTPELAAEIDRLDFRQDGYFIRRRNLFLGKWMNHGAWARDRVLRLFRREAASVPNRAVHEEVRVSGNTGELKSPLLHLAQNDFATIGRKFTDYLPLMAAEIAKKRGSNPPTLIEITLRPAWSFARDYFFRLGWLDGWRGLVLAAWGAASVMAKYAEARRIIEENSHG